MTAILENAATAHSDNPHHARRWWVLALLGIAQLMVVLDATIVNIALPTAQADLGFSDAGRQWIVTAYSLAFGSLLLIGGRVADVFGRKWVFVVGLIGFALASALGGAAGNFGVLVTARALQGGFGALLAPAGLALLTTTFTDAKERGKAFGIYGGIAGGGASLGLLLGGLLTEYASWRWTLYVNLIFAVIAVAGAVLLLHHRREAVRPKLDLPGTFLVTTGLFFLVYGFSRAETDGWGDTFTVTFLVLAAVLLGAFAVLQTRIAHPLLPLRIVLDRNRGGAFLAMLLASAAMFAVFLFLTYYLQVTLHYSSVKTGAAFLPMTAVLVAAAGVASTVLLARVSPKVLIPAGMVIGAAGMALLATIQVDSTYVGKVLPATLVIGLGLGLLFAPSFAIATLGVEEEDAGVAGAAVNAMQQVGGSIGTALFNTVAASALAGYLTSHAATATSQESLINHAAVHSYTVAFWIAAAVLAAGAALTALVLRPGVVEVPTDGTVVAMH